uniref:Uncharacterized protein n=1 Tax=Dunaliella tertiolecta TaxID=3047 RepID=A0A7S3VIS8_DUNTE
MQEQEAWHLAGWLKGEDSPRWGYLRPKISHFLHAPLHRFSPTGTFQAWVPFVACEIFCTKIGEALKLEKCQLGDTCQISCGMNPNFDHQIPYLTTHCTKLGDF